MNDVALPLVSVIVPTRNSANTLEICLESVHAQTYPHVEIIVVDNHSTDSTQEIAARYGKLYIKGPERSAQKNWGSKQSRGTCLLFLDSDCELELTVIEECVSLCQEGASGVMIPMEHVGQGFWAEVKKLERQCYLGDDSLEAPWFFTKTAFQAIHGFDEDLVGGEDWDIARRMRESGYNNIERSSAGLKHHIGHWQFWKELKKRFYYGQTMKMYLQKNRHSAIRQIPFFRSAYLRNWRLLTSHPFLTIGLFVLKFLETVFVGAGVLVAYLWGPQYAKT